MKLNKFVFVLMLAGILGLFASCNFGSVESVENKSPKVTVSIGGEYNNGDINVDPTKVEYIDVKFSESMNINYTGYIYYGEATNFDVTGVKWLNHFTLRLYVNMHYGQYYCLVFNDNQYLTQSNDPNYTVALSFLRDEKGNYLDQTRIEFSTMDSPEKHPKNYTVNVSNLTVELMPNEYKKNSQQRIYTLNGLFNHEVPQKGDTLTFKYKVKSYTDVSNLLIQIADNSEAVNWWKVLHNNNTEIVLIDTLKASTGKEEYWKEGEISIELTENPTSIYSMVVQFYAEYLEDNPDSKLYTLEFAEIK